MTFIAEFFIAVLWPFKLLFSFIFSFAWHTTGNYGLSLLIVSFCITAGTAPLYLLADKWKNGEKQVQRRMHRDIENINRYHTGSKRFYLTKAAHRIYGYKSWYALRTSFGLLIQIPFFFAAYEVLSEYSGYAGVSFMGIPDLARPDGLLMGINILPFVMTAVNIASSFYYSRSCRIRDNGQLLGMAAVFLVLLYNSPAALLVYWTMNNILSFVKAVVFRHAGLQKPPEREPVTAGKESLIHRLVHTEQDIAVFFFFILACSLEVFWIVNFKDSFKYGIVLTLTAAGVSSLYWVFWKKLYRIIPVYLLLWAVLVPLYLMFISNRKYNPYVSNENLKLAMTGIQTGILFLGFFIYGNRKRTAAGFSKLPGHYPPSLFRTYAAVVCTTVFFLLVYQPLSLYMSSPGDIGVPLVSFTGTLFLLSFAAVVLSLAIFMLVPRFMRIRLSELALFVLSVSLVWSLVFKMKTGMLDSFSFQHEDAITNIGLIRHILDPVLLTALLMFARDRLFGKGRSIVPFVLVLAGVLTLVLGIRVLRMDPDTLVQEHSSDPSLPASAHDSHQFSLDKPNVLFVVADMFNGNYIGRLVEENPGYAELLDGFVWYPDSLSVSYNTATSFPAIFAGYQWLPEALNGNGMTGKEEIRASARLFFDAARTAGFNLTVANPMYFLAEDASGARVENIYRYVPYWKSKNGMDVAENDSDKTLLPVMVSLFNAVPWHLKPVVYDDSNWIIFRRSVLFKQMKNKAIRDMAYLSLLPEISSAADTDGGLFLYVHNELPHSPFGITASGHPVEGEFPDPESNDFSNPRAAFYSAKKEIDLLIDLFSWMKEAGVYDNTLVMIISDHGNSLEDNGIPKSAGGESLFAGYDVSRARTLFLVKDFNTSGPLVTDTSFISSADVTAYLSEKAGVQYPGVAPAFPPAGETPRTYSVITGDWEDCLDRDTVTFRTYDVSGPITDAASWNKRQR